MSQEERSRLEEFRATVELSKIQGMKGIQTSISDSNLHRLAKSVT